MRLPTARAGDSYRARQGFRPLRKPSLVACCGRAAGGADEVMRMTPKTITRFLAALLVMLLAASAARARDKGTLNPQPLPPLANPNDPHLAAKQLFGRKAKPAPLEARSIGFYSKGCLAGGTATGDIPISSASWNVSPTRRPRSAGTVSSSATCHRRAAAPC